MSKFLNALVHLENWFQSQKRILPWRETPTVYRVWVSEIMLQQTQVAAVIPYFEKFMKKFPTVESLADAKLEDVLLQWSGLGYYSRARNLHKAAIKIVDSGKFPSSRDEWLEVPGVGNYTAGAILSIANHQPEAILDGNVERVLSRIRLVSRKQGDSFFKSRLWRLARIFVNTAWKHQIDPSVLNQALMELGATLCTPKTPRCEKCPLSVLCRAFARKEQELYPPKKKPKEWIMVRENLHCVMNSSGRILLRQRMGKEWRSGLWDLLDEIPDEIHSNSQFLGQVETKHVVTRHKICRSTQIWQVVKMKKSATSFSAAEPQLKQVEKMKWVSIDDPGVPMGSALKKTLEKVRLSMVHHFPRTRHQSKPTVPQTKK